MTNSSIVSKEENFLKSLRKSIWKYRIMRSANQWSSKIILLGSIIFSFLATVLVAAKDTTTIFNNIGLTTVLTGLPGVLLTIGQSLGFHSKSLYFNYGQSRLEEILIAVSNNRMSIDEGTDQWLALKRELVVLWNELSTPDQEAGAPVKRKPRPQPPLTR
jgi:hypothetical protein